MADWLEDHVRQTMATLKEQRDRLDAAQADIEARTASATSHDRMVTVTVDARNAVVGIEFHTTRYRSMPPAQLSEVLVDTFGQACRTMARAVDEVFRPFVAERDRLRAAMAGDTPVDRAFQQVWEQAPPVFPDRGRS